MGLRLGVVQVLVDGGLRGRTSRVRVRVRVWGRVLVDGGLQVFVHDPVPVPG